jgi:hypothetical protein
VYASAMFVTTNGATFTAVAATVPGSAKVLAIYPSTLLLCSAKCSQQFLIASFVPAP